MDRRAYGDAAEQRAVDFLEAAGYRVLARNYLCREGELDIVAEKDELLCIVEVRMRSRAVWGDPAHTVNWAKQRRVVRATLRYLHENRGPPRAIRFDVVTVLGQGDQARVEHIPAAFDAGM